MGSIGDPFTLPLPIVGTPGPDYATQISDALAEFAARVAGKVPFSAVNFGSDIPLNGQNILNAGYITLNNSASSPGSSPVNRITAYAGDLWYVSPSGAIQLTTGSALNAAAVGGITGDYGGANPAQFRYDSVTSRYTAFANFAGNTLAYIRLLGLDIAGTGSALARLAFGGSANQTYTLPPARPASATQSLNMDTSGNIVLGNTINRQYSYSAFGAVYQSGSTPGGNTFSTIAGMLMTNTDQIGKAIDGLPVGYVLSKIDFNMSSAISASFTLVLTKVDAAGTVSTLGSITSAVNGPGIFSLTLGTPETITNQCTYFLRGQANSAAIVYWRGFTTTGTLGV